MRDNTRDIASGTMTSYRPLVPSPSENRHFVEGPLFLPRLFLLLVSQGDLRLIFAAAAQPQDRIERKLKSSHGRPSAPVSRPPAAGRRLPTTARSSSPSPPVRPAPEPGISRCSAA